MKPEALGVFKIHEPGHQTVGRFTIGQLGRDLPGSQVVLGLHMEGVVRVPDILQHDPGLHKSASCFNL